MTSRVRRREGHLFELALEDYAQLEALLASFRREGIRVEELTIAATDLEQVFLRIMAGSGTSDETRVPALEVPES